MSPQQRWQRKEQALGNCIICGRRDRGNAVYWLNHALKKRERGQQVNPSGGLRSQRCLASRSRTLTSSAITLSALGMKMS